MADFAETIYVDNIAPHKYNFFREVIDLATGELADYRWEDLLDHVELWDILEDYGFNPEPVFAELEEKVEVRLSVEF
jgi:hypothetical protein